MVSLSSYPDYNHLSSSPPQKSVDPPLTIDTTQQLWTKALILTPPSPFLSLTHLRRLIRGLNLLPQPLLTPAQLSPLYLNVALILAFLGEYFLAAESFQKALELDSNSAIGWYGLAGMNFLLGDWEAARKAWRICLVCFGTEERVIYCVWMIGGNVTEAEASKDRRWALEKAKVEWNLRFTSFERTLELEEQKHQVWDINGIPAGLVFGPNFSATENDFGNEKENNGFRKENFECNTIIPQQLSANQPPRATRITSPAPKSYTKPLPALPLPARTSSTPPSVHRTPKGLSISRLFSKPRTSSASKSSALKPKRQELLAEPFSCYNGTESSPVFESNLFRDGFGNGKSHGIGVIAYATTANVKLFPSVFDTDSDSNEDAGAISYRLTPSASQTPKDEHVAHPAPTDSASNQLLPPRTNSHSAALVNTPRLESQKQALSPSAKSEKGKAPMPRTEDKEAGSMFQDMKRNELSTEVKTSGLNRMTVEVNEKKRSNAVHEVNSKGGAEKTKSQKSEVRGRSQTKYITTESRARSKEMAEEIVFAEKEEARLEPAKSQPLKTELAKSEPVKQHSAESKSAKTQLSKPESLKLEPAKPQPAKPQPAKPRPAKPKLMIPEPADLEEEDLWPAALRPAKLHPAKSDPAQRLSGTINPLTLNPVYWMRPFKKPGISKPHLADFYLGNLRPPGTFKALRHLDPTLEYLKPARFEGYRGEWLAADLAWEETLKMRALNKAEEGKAAMSLNE